MIKKASRLNTLNSNKYRNAMAGNTPSADVPDAPTSVSAADVGTGRAFNNGAATVSFTPAATGGSAASFTATSTPGGFYATGASSPITVTGLQSGISYTFKVVANNASGSSAPSPASSSITATTVPSAPTIGTPTVATGQPYTGSAGVSVAFTAPSSSGGKSITSYIATSSSSNTGSGSSSPVSVSDTVGTSRTYTVTATNANGTSTASSASSSVTPASVPQAPTLGTVTVASTTSVSIPFTAGATGGASISSYTITSSPALSLSYTVGSSPVTVTGTFAPSTAYTFTMTATNAEGTSASSNTSNAVTPLPAISDNFARVTTGGLGTSSSGAPWTAIKGTWVANNGVAQTSDAATNNSIATVNLGSPLVTVTATTTSLGAGIAFMVQDANNWWAAAGIENDSYTYAYTYAYTYSGTSTRGTGIYYYTYTTSSYTYTYSTPIYDSYTGGYYYHYGTGTGFTTTGPNGPYQYYATYYYSGTAYASPAPSPLAVTQYYLNLYQSVAGTVSTLATTAATALINSLKVVVHGTTVTATGYSDGAFNVVAATNSATAATPTGNLHGIILTSSTQNQGNSIGPFSAVVTN